jgi:muramoyltetrapeptide carboxypeptidase
MGTPWQPSFAGALLLLEDVGEPLYRIERMLVQLIQAGALNAVKAVILGDFHNCPIRGVTHSIEDIFEEHLQRLDVPIFTGGEFGHGERNRPWRIDGAALLTANRLVWSE